MRRMLQRCTLSVIPGPDGKLTYAPIIATELEHQLDEWYGYLPEALRFESRPGRRQRHVHSDFLATQYYAYKSSIYWPAVYQVMELEVADERLLLYCGKFFNSYICFIASANAATRACKPNAWTLYASIFIISLTALKASNVSCLNSAVPSEATGSFQLAGELLAAAAPMSPSLGLLENIFRQTREAIGTPSSY